MSFKNDTAQSTRLWAAVERDKPHEGDQGKSISLDLAKIG